MLFTTRHTPGAGLSPASPGGRRRLRASRSRGVPTRCRPTTLQTAHWLTLLAALLLCAAATLQAASADTDAPAPAPAPAQDNAYESGDSDTLDEPPARTGSKFARDRYRKSRFNEQRTGEPFVAPLVTPFSGGDDAEAAEEKPWQLIEDHPEWDAPSTYSKFARRRYQQETFLDNATQAALDRYREEEPEPQMPDTWTIETALRRALSVSPSLLQAQTEVERLKGVQMQYRADMLPRVTFSGSWSTKDDSLIDRVDPTLPPDDQNPVSEDSYRTSLEIRQTLFDGGSKWNSYQQQRAQLLGSEAAVKNTELEVISYVKQAYAAIILRREVIKIRQDALKVWEQVSEFAQKRLEAGDVTEFEIMRVNTELKNAQANLAQAGSGLVQSEQLFRRFLQLPLPEDPKRQRVEVVGTLEEVPFHLPLSQAVELARQRRHDLHRAQLDLESARRYVRAVKLQRLPQLEAFASYDWRSSYYDSSRVLDGWTVGVSGSLNVFSGGRTVGALKSGAAQLKSARMQLEQLDYQLRSSLSELYSSIDGSRSIIDYHRSSVELGQESLKVSSRMYEIGQGSLEDVLDAQISLQRSQLSYQQALYDFHVFLAQLEYAIGGPVEGLQTLGADATVEVINAGGTIE